MTRAQMSYRWWTMCFNIVVYSETSTRPSPESLAASPQKVKIQDSVRWYEASTALIKHLTLPRNKFKQLLQVEFSERARNHNWNKLWRGGWTSETKYLPWNLKSGFCVVVCSDDFHSPPTHTHTVAKPTPLILVTSAIRFNHVNTNVDTFMHRNHTRTHVLPQLRIVL